MKVFISINDLSCGGAQKSLISLLDCLKPSDGLDIDLLVLDNSNIFFDDIPVWINMLKTNDEIQAMFLKANELCKSRMSLKVKLEGIIAKLLFKLSKSGHGNTVQRIWSSWKNFIPSQKSKYDLAISYVDGFSNYYVIDKVIAQKKIIWVHNEYEKLSYDPKYDLPYFEKANYIVTISNLCIKSLNNIFPSLSGKFRMLPNISSIENINKMAGKNAPIEYKGHKNILLSIGRLNEQKGFDLAIKAANILKNKDIDFCWFIIGQGELEKKLKLMIHDYKLEEEFKLIGIRENPYPYIKYCLIFIQPSRYEGKSIVLDEAKILEKPIIVTNYPTVYDSIKNGFTGTIVDFDEIKLADSIEKMINSELLRNTYSNNLRLINHQNNYIQDYLDLFLSNI